MKESIGLSVKTTFLASLALAVIAATISCQSRPPVQTGAPACSGVDYSAIVRLVTLQSVHDAEGRAGAKGWRPNAITEGTCTPEGYWRFVLYEDKGQGLTAQANQMSVSVAPSGRLLNKEAHAELVRLTDQLETNKENPYGASLSFPPVGARAWFRVVKDEHRTIVRMTFTTHDEKFDVELDSNTAPELPPANSYWNYAGLLEESYRKSVEAKKGY
jgi:hypothetical protein